jgi:pimeloyl-ACP methyl ester carboxylesterase
MSRRGRAASLAALLVLSACGDDGAPSSGGSGAGGEATGASGGSGASSADGGGGTSSTGGAGGATVDSLDDLLTRLRADRDGTLLEESAEDAGWPVAVEEGWVIVSADPAFGEVAGGFNDWSPAPLTQDQGFAYVVVPFAAVPADRGYKLVSGDTFAADPWSRSFAYDDFGELSLVHPDTRRLDRFFRVTSAAISPRTVTVLHPGSPPSHVLYVHDGQNLFDPDAFFGGWQLDDTAPAGMMLVGIDNSPARMVEYTHVADDLGSGPIGGDGDAYVDFLEDVVRPLVADHYGEPPKVGVMGSSLGGLISLHAGYRHPDSYDFVASLSGTVGWGSFGPHTGETVIERYADGGLQPFVVYLDSGGDGPCSDLDGDGIDDDGDGTDNYCENLQLRDALAGSGWTFEQDLFHWHESGAPHNEAAWAARVFRPLEIFAAL